MAMLAIPAAAELLADVGGTAAISKLANTLLSKGGKKMAKDVVRDIGKLAGSKEGRQKILRRAGKVGGGVAKAAGVGAKLLGAAGLVNQRKAERIIEKGHMGFQSSLGKISKIGKHLGFL